MKIYVRFLTIILMMPLLALPSRVSADISSIGLAGLDSTSATIVATVTPGHPLDTLYLFIRRDFISPTQGLMAFPSDTTGTIAHTVHGLLPGTTYTAFAAYGQLNNNITGQYVTHTFTTPGTLVVTPPNIVNLSVTAERWGTSDSIHTTISGRYIAPSNGAGAVVGPYIQEMGGDTFARANVTYMPLWSTGSFMDTSFTFDVYNLHAGQAYLFQFQVYSQDSMWYWDVPLLMDTFAVWSGIGGHNVTTEIQVFPNPSKETVRVRLPSLMRDAMVSLYALDGREVYTATMESETLLDVSALPMGVYTIHVRVMGLTYTLPFVKQ